MLWSLRRQFYPKVVGVGTLEPSFVQDFQRFDENLKAVLNCQGPPAVWQARWSDDNATSGTVVVYHCLPCATKSGWEGLRQSVIRIPLHQIRSDVVFR